jgi:hypothetical protein
VESTDSLLGGRESLTELVQLSQIHLLRPPSQTARIRRPERGKGRPPLEESGPPAQTRKAGKADRADHLRSRFAKKDKFKLIQFSRDLSHGRQRHSRFKKGD